MFKRILRSRLFTLLLAVFILFLILPILMLQPSLTSVRKEVKNLDQKIVELEKTKFESEKMFDYLKSQAYLERQARLKLNYKKPNEKVVYVYTKEQQENAPENLKANNGGLADILKKWRDFLFGR